jgi:nucleotide-binding universal stress UspA family protein
VLARAQCPVVLVRAAERAAGGAPGAAPAPEVVLGLDVRRPCGEVVGFAFEAAAVRSAPLLVVRSRRTSGGGTPGLLPPDEEGAALRKAEEDHRAEAALRPWRERFPQVRVVLRTAEGNPVRPLVEASSRAGLLVVGRRERSSALGAHVGPVTHAAVHHARCPVAVVPFPGDGAAA